MSLMQAGEGAWIGIFVLASMGSVVLGSLLENARRNLKNGEDETWNDDRFKARRVLEWLGLGGGVILLATTGGMSGFTWFLWAYMGLLGLGGLVLGRLHERYIGLSILSAIATLAMLWTWDIGHTNGDITTFCWVTGVMGVLYDVVCYLNGMQKVQLHLVWIGTCRLAGLAFFWTGYVKTIFENTYWIWWLVGGGTAGLYAAIAALVVRKRESGNTWGKGSEMLVSAAGSLLIGTVLIELDNQWITIAWAGIAGAIAICGKCFGMNRLLDTAMGIRIAATIRLVLNPAIIYYPTDGNFIWNWMIYTYPTLIGSMVLYGRLCRKQNRWDRVGTFDALAVMLSFAMVTLLARYGFTGEGFGLIGEITSAIGLLEIGTYINVWLGLATVMLGFGWKKDLESLRFGGVAALWLGLAGSVLGLCLAMNPLWYSSNVGEMKIVN